MTDEKIEQVIREGRNDARTLLKASLDKHDAGYDLFLEMQKLEIMALELLTQLILNKSLQDNKNYNATDIYNQCSNVKEDLLSNFDIIRKNLDKVKHYTKENKSCVE
jgi:hypothetical protein